MYHCSGGAGGEQQCSGCICDSSGATGSGEAGEIVSAEEDQTCGHDNSLSTGDTHQILTEQN